MSNLPVHKDHFSGEYAGGEVLWLDEKQIRQIEAGAKLKLTNALIAELSFAIDNYLTSSGKAGRTAIPRSKTRRTFRSLKKQLDLLNGFFSDITSPEAKEARHKIESALWFLTAAAREELKKTPGLPRDEIKRLNEAADMKKPLVDTGRFQIDLVYLGRAIQAASDRLEQEAKAERSRRMSGSRKEVAFDRFLEDLEGIYCQATKVKGSFVDFLLALLDTMPEKNRPRLPSGWVKDRPAKSR